MVTGVIIMSGSTLIKAPVSEKPARKYVPDISGFISLCDSNYAKLMKLLPAFESKDRQCFGLARGDYELGVITIEVTERCKYTTTLKLRQGFSSARSLLNEPEMDVRLYHDATMAEVMSFQQMGKFRGSYDYPNEHMHQKDEKALCNQFLSDWLSYCLRYGYATETQKEACIATEISGQTAKPR
jgi:uncharacterized protein